MSNQKLLKYISIVVVLSLIIIPAASSALSLAATSSCPTLYLAYVTKSPYQSLSTFNPNLFDGGLGGDFYGLIFAYTITLNVSNNEVIPCLISNWTFSPSNWEQVWQNETVNVTITLRHSGWANGQPVTAYDILATCLILTGLFSAPPYPNYTIVNNYTIIISEPPGKMSPILLSHTLICSIGLGEVALIISYQQYKPLIQQIESNWTQIQHGDTSLIKELRNELHNYIPPGPISANYNGPYYVASITPSEIVLEKNPYYFAASNVKFNKIIVYQYQSTSDFYAALLKGQISLDLPSVVSVCPKVLSKLPSCYKVINIPNPGGWALYFNFKNPWLKMVQVRQAIAYVLNRTSIALAGGYPKFTPVKVPNGIPCCFSYLKQFITPAVSNLNPYCTNLSKAKQLLESVGFTCKNGQWYTPNGTPFTLTIQEPFTLSPCIYNMMNVIKDELTSFGIPTTYYVCTNVNVDHEHYRTGTGYDLVFQHWGGFCIGTVDWYLETQYLNGIPLNVTQWDGIVTLPNGTQVNVVKLYKETVSPNSTSQLIAANDEMAYALNYYLPALPLVFQACQIVVNTKQLNVPPSNSWFWQEYFYGIAGTAIYQLGFTDGLIQPVIVTTTPPTTTTVTSTLPVVDIAVGVIVVIIIIAAVAIIMRRR